jgi:hypothetical protein
VSYCIIYSDCDCDSDIDSDGDGEGDRGYTNKTPVILESIVYQILIIRHTQHSAAPHRPVR